MGSEKPETDAANQILETSRRRLLAMLGVGGVGGLAGCAGGGGEETTTAGGGGEETTTAGGGGESAPTFNFALGSAPSTLDVHKTGRVPEEIVVDAITDPLFRLNENKEPIPHLVSEFERSDNASKFVFQLEEGITYHNGDPFNAESAAWNLKRFLEVGRQAIVLGEPDTIEATGEYELTMEYPGPKPRLPIQLANWFTGFAPKSVVEEAGKDFGQTVNAGLGPYEFVEWKKGSHITVKRREDYDFGPEFASNRGPAHLGKIVFRIIPESTTRVNELTAGSIHGTPYVPLSDATSVSNNSSTSLHENPFPYPAYFPMNMQKEPTSDLRVRRAIAHAIRRQPIIDAAVAGHGTPIWGLAPPNSVNGLPEEKAKQWGYTHNLEKARSLLDEAGWTNDKQGEIRTKNGNELKLIQLGFALKQWSTQGKVAQALLKKVGIKIDLQVVEGGTFYSKIKNQNYHMITGGTGANFAADLLKHIFSTGALATKGGFNVSMFESEKMDSLIDTALSSPSAKKREEAILEAEKLALEKAAYVPIMVLNRTYGHKNQVKNVDKFLQHDWWPNQYYLHHLEVDL